MPYEVTATRKRPKDFNEFKGQEFVSATLVSSLESGRIAHAYLFSGPRGCGKTSAARILAKSLNCEKGPSAKPCGVCRSCVEIARGASLDVIEIDGASNTSVDNVRQIKDEVLFPPNGGRYKVYIIDEVHMLSNSAFNALLKTIEEPPPYIVFIFATTELHKVPATIKSRCQQFAFRLFKIDLIKSLLAEAAAENGIEAEDEALLWIAKEARGSLRDAYTLFDQVVSFAEGRISAELIRDKLGLTGLEALGELFRACAAGDTGAALSAINNILERGVSAEQLVSEAADYCRSLLLIKNGIDKVDLLGAPVSAFDSFVVEQLNAEQIERSLALILALYRDLRYTVDQRFELELAFSRLCRLRDYVSPQEVAKAVGELRRCIGGGAVAASIGRLSSQNLDLEKKKPLTGTEAEHIPTKSDRRDKCESPGASNGSAEHLRGPVIEELGRSSPLLKTGLASSLPWREENGKLIIVFKSGMEESVVRPSVADIAAKASELAGRPVRVELRVESASGCRQEDEASLAQSAKAPDPIAIVERVFRGTRVDQAGRGE
jgi:DNA polymerase-3 subunit gamma/tau